MGATLIGRKKELEALREYINSDRSDIHCFIFSLYVPIAITMSISGQLRRTLRCMPRGVATRLKCFVWTMCSR